MQLAGPGVFGPPADRDEAVAVLREAVDLGITHIDTSDFYGPHVTNEIIQRGAAPLSRRPAHRHQGRRRRDAEGGWPHARSPQRAARGRARQPEHLGLDVLDVVNLRLGGRRRSRAGLARRAVHGAGRAAAARA